MTTSEKGFLFILLFISYSFAYGLPQEEEFNAKIIKNSLFEGRSFMLYNETKYEGFLRAQVLDDRKCIGLETPTNETIVLECEGKNSKHSGCYEVFIPETNSGNANTPTSEKQITLCVSELSPTHPKCRGITTPDNWTILFYCEKNLLSLTSAFRFNGPPPRM